MTEKNKWIIGAVLIPLIASMIPKFSDMFSSNSHYELEYHWSDYVKVRDFSVFKVNIYNFKDSPQENVSIRFQNYLEKEDITIESNGDAIKFIKNEKYLIANLGRIRKNDSITVKFMVNATLYHVGKDHFDGARIVSDSSSAQKYSYKQDWSKYYQGAFLISLLVLLLFIYIIYTQPPKKT